MAQICLTELEMQVNAAHAATIALEDAANVAAQQAGKLSAAAKAAYQFEKSLSRRLERERLMRNMKQGAE